MTAARLVEYRFSAFGVGLVADRQCGRTIHVAAPLTDPCRD
jgi:hypothetical protein